MGANASSKSCGIMSVTITKGEPAEAITSLAVGAKDSEPSLTVGLLPVTPLPTPARAHLLLDQDADDLHE